MPSIADVASLADAGEGALLVDAVRVHRAVVRPRRALVLVHARRGRVARQTSEDAHSRMTIGFKLLTTAVYIQTRR